MTLSIVIVNWNTKPELQECLTSLQQAQFDEDWEPIVVDNASSDGSAEMVRNLFPTCRLIASNQNLGYAAGNNEGIAVSQGEFILTLNPDTVLPPDTLARSVQVLRQKPDFGVLGVQLIGLDGNTQRSVRGFPTPIGIFGAFTGLAKLFPGSAFDSYSLQSFNYNKSQPAHQPMGTFLLYRRSALDAIGALPRPFDEQFPIFFNEVDLLKRLADAGLPCWYESEIAIQHVHGAGTKKVRKAMIWESHRSLARYLHKHWAFGARKLAMPFIGALLWVSALIRAKGFHVGFRP